MNKGLITGITSIVLFSSQSQIAVEGILVSSSSLRTAAVTTTIITNAKIYTVNPSQPSAEAMSIDHQGVILQVGSNDDILGAGSIGNSSTGENFVTIDMGGRRILPGFQDAHMHVVEAGINAAACLFDPEPIMEDIPLYFDDCDSTFGDQGWLLGAGIDASYVIQQIANGSEYPITILDRAFPDTPVLILDSLGHAAFANSVAMKKVGYDQLTSDPPGGRVLRENGVLTGVVLENAQQKLRDAAFPPTTANQQTAYQSLLDALKTLAANGITSVSDAGGFWRQAQTEAWSRAEKEGLLTVRASNALYVYPDQSMDEQLPELLARFSNDATALVKFNQAKIYVDGILSLGTGALFDPYAEGAGICTEYQYGFEYFGDNSTLFDVSKTLASNGFQLHFHVTGDRGASLALDAIELLDGGSTVPHRLTHCYLVDEADRGRFAELGAFADFQAAPSSLDPEYIDFMSQVILGPDRASQLIPLVEVSNAGAKVVLSSDWDADELSPIVKIKTVMTRPDGRNFPDVETVIPLMTKNVAELLGTNTGSLEPGKLADLVALDDDIIDAPVESIDKISVVFTMFNGRVVYDPLGIAGSTVGTPTSSVCFTRGYSAVLWMMVIACAFFSV